jgi:dTDP-4-amino-4,6-dideoxygalactose transaminase
MGVFYAMGLQNSSVITTPLTWPGAISGLIALNCKILFCDVEPVTLTLDPEKLKQIITPEIKAVFTADFLGYPAKLDLIKEICIQNNSILIHDAASSFGSYYHNHFSGYYADVAILSFGKNKLFSIGEGGCVVTNNQSIYEKLLFKMSHPQKQQIIAGYANPFALNTNMNPFAAEYGNKFLNLQLINIRERASRIEKWLSKKNIMSINNNSKPNYYKILITNKQIDIIQNESIVFLSGIPFNEITFENKNCTDFIIPGTECFQAKFANNRYCTIDISNLN